MVEGKENTKKEKNQKIKNQKEKRKNQKREIKKKIKKEEKSLSSIVLDKMRVFCLYPIPKSQQCVKKGNCRRPILFGLFVSF